MDTGGEFARLAAENAVLRRRLAESEELLNAIRSGEIDAVVVNTPDGDRIFSLEGADRPYRVLVESMNEGALTLVAPGVICYANQCFAALLRIPLEALIGTDFKALLSPAEQAEFDELFIAGLKAPTSRELHLEGADAARIPALLSLAPTHVESVRAVGVIVTDLTVSKREAERERWLEADRAREVALAESEARFRHAADATRALIYEVDLGGETDNGTAKVYGLEHIIGNRFEGDALTGAWWHARIHPDDASPHFARVAGYLRDAGRAFYVDCYRVRHADGSWRHVEDNAQILRDEFGSPYRLVGTIVDVTERFRVEEALRASARRFQLLAETSTVLLRRGAAEPVVNELCGQVMAFLECDVFLNYLLVPTADMLHLNAWRGLSDEEARRCGRIGVGEGICGRVAQAGVPFIAEDLARSTEVGAAFLRSIGLCAYACQPLTVQGRTIGTLAFGSRLRSRFTRDELSLMEAVTDQVAIALQRQQHEATLREGEHRLRLALDAANAGTWELIPATGAFLASDRALEMLGLSGNRVLTREHALSRIHADDRTRLLAALQNSLEINAPFKMELRVPTEHGSHRWVAAYAELQRTDESSPRLVGLIQDVTERKQAVESLEQSESRFRLMADGVPAIVWLTDPQGRVEFVNREYCEFFGVTVEQVQKDGWQPLVHPQDFDLYVGGFMSALARRARFEGRARVRHVSGEWRWIHSLGEPRLSRSGAFLGYVGISPDVTALIVAQHALQDADRQKDEFLAMLAHELRNPLAPIRNAVAALRATTASDSPLDAVYAMIERQVLHLTRLVDDLLDVSRVSQRKITLQRTPVDVVAVVNAAVDLVRPLIDEKRHTVSLMLPPRASVWIDADATRLAQAIGNLLNNAAKYTEERGTIDVLVRTEPEAVLISIRDSGVGIAADLLPNVFGLFVQADRSLDRSQGGLGIGLSLVKSLVELHGGSVSAASAGLGRGSEFSMRLPRCGAPETSSAFGTRCTRVVPRRVLVVDDNVDAADSISALLELDGHTVLCLYDGRRAIELATQFRPDIALLDIGMPGLDGYAVARALREAPGTRTTVLLAVTGYGQDQDFEQSRAVGFARHLVKPVDPEELAVVISSLAGM